jgi:hypothetical protein
VWIIFTHQDDSFQTFKPAAIVSELKVIVQQLMIAEIAEPSQALE